MPNRRRPPLPPEAGGPLKPGLTAGGVSALPSTAMTAPGSERGSTGQGPRRRQPEAVPPSEAFDPAIALPTPIPGVSSGTPAGQQTDPRSQQLQQILQQLLGGLGAGQGR